jgi:hypothetical protein
MLTRDNVGVNLFSAMMLTTYFDRQEKEKGKS